MKGNPARSDADPDAIDPGASMEELWGDFSRIAIPHIAPDSMAYHDIRAAFHFGAFYLLAWLHAQPEDEEEFFAARLAVIAEQLNAVIGGFRDPTQDLPLVQ